MALGTARSNISKGENISHFTGIRLRVTGSGSLRPTLYSLDDIRSEVLVAMTMSATTNIEPFRLSNFMEQRARLELKTTALNETFRINRIIIFAKPIFTMYPA